MNFQLNRAFGLAIVAGALTVGAAQVKAEVYKGTFNLPVETYWGGAVLAPGQYTLSIEHGNSSPMIRVSENNRQVASVLTGPYVPDEKSTRGSLTLVQINGSYVVKTFDAGLIGKSFTFATPKVIRNRQVEAKETSRIVVDAAGTH
jgi:hypothetical protein